ncbi:hypothetical protein [Microlunatus parietis]|uniref:MFS family permease n=1 Tax=Microlunatus parietis TaxID=682979 RepID=A0A7Y9I9M9_9ACTN|nr:hypothetical protein [Microlunatus parietis]NYE72712.1 MFS family permease [Microlunatus parietis]
MTDTSVMPVEQPAERRERPWRLVLLCGLAGVIMAVLWSPRLVDKVIAGGIANPLFGGDISEVAITGAGMAAVFAFVTGAAGMFTACNVAVFSALAPMTAHRESARSQAVTMLRALGLLLAGAIVVSGIYGVIVVLFGANLPQLSTVRIGDPVTGVPLRSVQSGIVFGLIGVIMVWRGLAYLGLVKNPLEGLFRRHPGSELIFFGALIGAFLIGRPFGPFRNLLEYAVSTHNPLLGFATLALQSIGNVLGVALIFVVIMVVSRGGFQRWLTREPGRAARFSAGAFILAGTFFLVYWVLRLGSRLGHWWWPVMPYNA